MKSKKPITSKRKFEDLENDDLEEDPQVQVSSPIVTVHSESKVIEINSVRIENSALFSETDILNIKNGGYSNLKNTKLMELGDMIVNYYNAINKKKGGKFRKLTKDTRGKVKEDIVIYLKQHADIMKLIIPHLQSIPVEKPKKVKKQTVNVSSSKSLPSKEDSYKNSFSQEPSAGIEQDAKVAVFGKNDSLLAFGVIVRDEDGNLEANSCINVEISETFDQNQYELEEVYLIPKDRLVQKLHIVKEAYSTAEEYFKRSSEESKQGNKDCEVVNDSRSKTIPLARKSSSQMRIFKKHI